LAALLPAWKQEFGWPSDVPAQALQQSLKDLDQAYINFFKDRANSPVFRKKSKKDSFRIPQGFEVDSANGRVKLPKLGWIRYRKSRDMEGKPKNITVSLGNGKIFISIQTEREVNQPLRLLPQKLEQVYEVLVPPVRRPIGSVEFDSLQEKVNEQTSCNLCAGFLRPSEGGPHYRQSDYSPGGICEDKRIRGAAGMGLLRQRAKGILQRRRRFLAVC
jgi:hypothetical protein